MQLAASFRLLLLILFSVAGSTARAAPPTLRCEVAGGQATLTWPVTGYSYALERTSDLVGGVWSTVATAPTEADGQLSVSLPLDPKAAFFRLRWINVASRVLVVANEDDEDVNQIAPGSYNRPTSDPSPWGGIMSLPLLGSSPANIINAGYTTVPGTDSSQLSYDWKFYYPENRNSGIIFYDVRNRILGKNTAQVTLLANALPDLGPTQGQNEWRVFLTITNTAGPTPQVTNFRFRVRYQGSSLTIATANYP